MGWEKALIDLGNLGAAMLIIYLIAKMLFKYLEGRGKADNSGINKLCDRIDTLINAFHTTNLKMNEVLTTLVADKEASQGQFSLILTKLDTVDKHVSSVASDLFTAFREHNQHSEDKLNNICTDVSGMETELRNLQDSIKIEMASIKESINKELSVLREFCKIKHE